MWHVKEIKDSESLEKMSFPEPYIVEPMTSHTHTVILLHGRSSEGPEFADELFSSKSSKKENLPAHFPSWRWVFPTSRERWSTVYQEEFPAWFDIHSLTNPNTQQDIQVEGLKESTLHALEVLRREIELLGGDTGKIILGGMSQGMALALWVLLCSAGKTHGKLGALVGMCGWLPFANKIEELLQSDHDVSDGDTRSSHAPGVENGLATAKLLLSIIECQDNIHIEAADVERLLSTPVLLLHGADDTWVEAGLGRQAHKILAQLGMEVKWIEYSGAENEGHWVKEPEGFDTLISFLEEHVSRKE